MRMQQHILAALREEYAAWEALLAPLSDEQLTAPLADGWSIKDVIAHLWAWQQRSVARLEAALADREPIFPAWPPGLDPETPGQPDRLNDWLYQASRDRPLPQVLADWRAGFGRLLELGAAIAERDLLDGSRYPWMEGRPLALILVASYDHHHEHIEALHARPGPGGA